MGEKESQALIQGEKEIQEQDKRVLAALDGLETELGRALERLVQDLPRHRDQSGWMDTHTRLWTAWQNAVKERDKAQKDLSAVARDMELVEQEMQLVQDRERDLGNQREEKQEILKKVKEARMDIFGNKGVAGERRRLSSLVDGAEKALGKPQLPGTIHQNR
jgi:TPP-dependent trihydroxycyclohexane-1,2-dione (THcHDO) dehydratase